MDVLHHVGDAPIGQGAFTEVLSNFEQLPGGVKAVMMKFDVLRLWRESLGGQLPVRTVAFQLSVAAFFLFLTAKVLEVRKWS